MSCGRHRRRPTLSSTLSSRLHHRLDISSSNTQSTEKFHQLPRSRKSNQSRNLSKQILHENSTDFDRFRILDDKNQDVTPRKITDYVRMSIKTQHEDEPSTIDVGNKRIIENRESFISEKSILGTNNLSMSTSLMARTGTHFSAGEKATLDIGTRFIMESEQLLNRTHQDKASYTSRSENQDFQAKFLPGYGLQLIDSLTDTAVLSETETIFILDLESHVVSHDDEDEYNKTNEINKHYMELCQNRSGNDLYIERGMQTFNNLPKNEQILTDPIFIKSRKTWANMWDIHDSLAEANQHEGRIYRQFSNHEIENVNDGEMKIDEKMISNQSSKGTSSLNSSTFFSEDSVVKMTPSKTKCFELNESQRTQLPEIDVDTLIMERILNANTYHKKQIVYQGYQTMNRYSYQRFSITKDNECLYKEDSPMNKYTPFNLVRLWHYSSSLTEDRNVSCLCWNQHNHDLLAVGYGKLQYNDDREGLVCCWNAKNPEFPERYYQTDAGVTSLAFSHKRTNLLAVGLFNGNICIFDLKQNNTSPVVDTNHYDKRHTGPVWQLVWNEQDRSSDIGTTEVLISISSDGRITKWILRKEFEATDLMHLKSCNASQESCQALKGSDGTYINGHFSNFVGGLCFDIRVNDRTIYLCGTDEGLIHRCSTIYNEKYLESYRGHLGPVYKVHWSPFAESVFLSASADWTVRLWMIGYSQSCLICSSSKSKAFFDVIWSPKSATMFFCVSEKTVEIWDLSKSVLEPIYIAYCLDPLTLTSIAYATESDCLLVGTSNGTVWIYHLENLSSSTNVDDLISIIHQGVSSQIDNDEKSITHQETPLTSTESTSIINNQY